MNWKKTKWNIRYYFQYSPFTLNTFLCAAAIWLGYKVLYKPPVKDDTSAFTPFINLMGKMTFGVIVTLILLSVASTFVSWAYYLWLQKKKQYNLQVNFTTETRNGRKNKLYLNAMLQGVFRPILGFIKGRLFYDDHDLTDKFSMLSNKRKERGGRRVAISGQSRISLPDIKEYELKGGFIFFEDMLHIFSLAVRQPLSGQFYQPPVLKDEEDREVYPKKTETMDVRIDQLRRVEGEYLNYKDFEAGDDVRRIVWKVYAKNRELVVRMPEQYEPYASHLYFYASFHAAVKAHWLGQNYLKEMLNYYKNNVWTVYDTLAKKEWEMKYIPDQSFTLPAHLPAPDKAARIISNSTWHTSMSLATYFNPRQAAVICISSLTDPEELRNILELSDASTVIYLVKTSLIFSHIVAWNWLKRLIFLPPADRLSKVRARWVFSPMRFQIVKREKELEQILSNSHVIYGVL
jgi:hypothetical protein